MPNTSSNIFNSSIRKVVDDCALFKQLSNKEVDTLLESAKLVELDEGNILVKQGQPSKEFFLTLSGEMKLAAISSKGQEKILHIIQPGQTFAEVLMFLEQPVYPANIIALMPSQVLTFPSCLYKNLLAESVDACFGLLAEYAMRNRQLISEIEALTLHNATFRVVSYLLKEVASHQRNAVSVELRTPKHAIASRVSITPETLSRILAKLKKEGVVEVSDKYLTLHDLDWMRKFVQLS